MGALYGILGGSLLVYLVMAWAITKLAGFTGMDSYIVYAILAALGIVGVAIFAWWKMRRESAGVPEGSEEADAGTADEISVLVKDAEAKLAAAQLGKDASLSNLPLVFVIGDQGSTKTSVVMNSGIGAELLAGHVYGDNNLIAPTRTANLWLAGKAIIAEVGAKVLTDPAAWLRIVRRLKPGTLKSVVGGSTQAPRAAVVCVNAEIFTQQGAADQLSAMSRALNEKLGQISQALGISFPVYVLFTRVDRLPFFADYVRTLSTEEAGQVLGATLPMRQSAGGVYAEEEAGRLSSAFNEIFHSLADHRIEFLPREGDMEKVPGAYEFPREFRKLRTPLVQFLVDLCRPSQLRVSPFLRGFYFCGVRPVVVQDTPVAAAAPPPRAGFSSASSATGVFQVPGFQPSAQAAAPQYAGTKRVPQWVFLTRLFHGIILQDRAALSASGASTKTSSLRRLLLASASLLLLVLAVLWTVSFLRNRDLVQQAVTAAENISATEAAGDAVASLESLQRLETLRQSLEQLTTYRSEGRPTGMGLGLYAGDDLYPHVRAAYYHHFAQLLFRQAQGSLVKHLKGLPATPGAGDDFGQTYQILKGYLITTTASDKSSEQSPAPILLARWAEGRSVDEPRMRLAGIQFSFYARDLRNGNPYSSVAEVDGVERGRSFLAQFSGIESIYQSMLSAASGRTVNYNRDIKDSARAVINNRDVPGAFTKEGYAFMQDALLRPDQFFGGDKWVMCEQTGNVPARQCPVGNVDPAKLTQDLSAKYVNDFIANWRNYFRSTSVLRYSNLRDAAAKLNLHSGPQSPILGVFWLASQNLGVDYTKIPGADRIEKAFQPVLHVVPAGQADRYVAPSNQPYHSALGTLQVSIDAAANMPSPDPGTVSNTLNNATNARAALRQVAQGFNIDQEGHIEQTVQKLLEDPITNAESLLRSLGPRELNGKGAGLCSDIGPVLNKYPFNPSASAEASLAEVNQVLRPGEGAIWAFYDLNLREGLAKQGAQYVPTGKIPLNPGFVSFFNTMARFSESIYKSGPDPKLTYTVRPLGGEGTQDVVLTIDGQPLPAASGQARQFTWPGSGQGARFTAKIGSADVPFPPYEGLWAPFRLFNSAETWEPAGTGYNLEWILQLRLGSSTASSANAPRARYFVDLNGAPLFFKKTGGAIRCVSQVAR